MMGIVLLFQKNEKLYVFFYLMFQIPVLNGITGDCVFKFEPFVLHVQCLTIKHAQLMVSINSFEQFVLYIEKMKECVGKQS